MIICSKCGTELIDNVKFCTNCGTDEYIVEKIDNVNFFNMICAIAKKEVETTLNDLGMNIAEAVTIFLKQVVITESIPFVIKKPRAMLLA